MQKITRQWKLANAVAHKSKVVFGDFFLGAHIVFNKVFALFKHNYFVIFALDVIIAKERFIHCNLLMRT